MNYAATATEDADGDGDGAGEHCLPCLLLQKTLIKFCISKPRQRRGRKRDKANILNSA